MTGIQGMILGSKEFEGMDTGNFVKELLYLYQRYSTEKPERKQLLYQGLDMMIEDAVHFAKSGNDMSRPYMEFLDYFQRRH